MHSKVSRTFSQKATISIIILIVLIALVGILVIRSHTNVANKVKTKTEKINQTDINTVRYLPLGDSYTIGQSEPESENFPNQLARKLTSNGTSTEVVANPAVTGYTTENLINYELPLLPKLKPTFVTILIGVNDYVQGITLQTFQSNLDYIINDVQKYLPNPNNIVLITIPDFSKTPTGAEFGSPATLEQGVESFNSVIKTTAAKYNLPLADIFPVSEGVATNSNLIASDGLHPSPEEYSLWVNIIYKTIEQNLHL